MALSVVFTDSKLQADGVGATITSNTLTGAATGDWIDVIEVTGDNTYETAWTVSNTGTAITWVAGVDVNG